MDLKIFILQWNPGYSYFYNLKNNQPRKDSLVPYVVISRKKNPVIRKII